MGDESVPSRKSSKSSTSSGSDAKAESKSPDKFRGRSKKCMYLLLFIVLLLIILLVGIVFHNVTRSDTGGKESHSSSGSTTDMGHGPNATKTTDQGTNTGEESSTMTDSSSGSSEAGKHKTTDMGHDTNATKTKDQGTNIGDESTSSSGPASGSGAGGENTTTEMVPDTNANKTKDEGTQTGNETSSSSGPASGSGADGENTTTEMVPDPNANKTKEEGTQTGNETSSSSGPASGSGADGENTTTEMVPDPNANKTKEEGVQTAGDESSSSSGPASGSGVDGENKTTAMVPDPSAKTNAQGTNTGGTAESNTTSPEESSSMDDRDDRRYLLICTVSYHAHDKIQYPPDGICNILFYTNAYYDEIKEDFVGSLDTGSFDVFRSQARSANTKMAYGVSFEYQLATSSALAIKDDNGKSKFQKLWDDKIHHYGILQAWDEPNALKDPNSKLGLIKELKQQTDKIKGEQEVELVIGFQFSNGNDLDSVKEIAEYLIKTYPITVLVALTHLFAKQKVDPYFSNGPSTWDGCAMKDNSKADCPHLMKVIGTQLKTLDPKEDLAMMVSFTMTALFWRINRAVYWHKTYVNFNQSGYWRSKDFTPVEYSQSCVENFTEPKRLDKAGDFMYTGSGDNWFLLAFDTSETLERKMKKFFDLMGPRPGRKGWAVYDVDYDDYSNLCNYASNFQRLRTVSKYLRQWATRTTVAMD